MATPLTLDDLSTHTKAELLKGFKNKAAWKKSTGFLALVDYPLEAGGKLPFYALPFRKKKDLTKAWKERIKKDTSAFPKRKTAVGSVLRETDEAGNPVLVLQIEHGGLSAEVAESKGAAALFKKIGTAIAVKNADQVPTTDEKADPTTEAATDSTETTPHSSGRPLGVISPLDALDGKSTEEQTTLLKNTFQLFKMELSYVQKVILPLLKRGHYKLNEITRLYTLKGHYDALQAYYAKADAAVQAAFKGAMEQVTQQEPAIQRILQYARQHPTERKGQQNKYDPLVLEAFVLGEGDTNAIDPNDVDQGYLGNCFYMATIASIARVNPDRLKKLIKDNGDGTYDVTIHVWKSFIATKGAPTVVRVSNETYVDRKGVPVYAGKGDGELWVILLEKAYAAYMGTYDKLNGGQSASAMQILTGEKGQVYRVAQHSQEELTELLQAAASEKKIVVLETNVTKVVEEQIPVADGQILVSGHAYSLISFRPDAIALQNPWGHSDLVVNMELVKEHFLKIVIG